VSGELIFFWLFAGLSVIGAIATITRRNAVMAVMCLVGTILSMSALYAMLYAHFLAIIQILVYAGAIMVIFVFVVMILNKEEDEPWALRGLFGKGLAGAGLVVLTGRLIQLLWKVRSPKGEPTDPAFGTVRNVGRELFSSYLFPFEAVSLVLLVAVVGALLIAHGHRAEEDTP